MMFDPTNGVFFIYHRYFNGTGPIYQQELVQANEFAKFVHAHVVAANNGPDGNPDPENDTVQFDWEGFRVALSSSQGKVSCMSTIRKRVDKLTHRVRSIVRT